MGIMGPEFDGIARGVNAPIYDYYAGLFKDKSGITEGVCVDVGAGGGYLGLSIAAITDLEIIFLDIDSGSLETAKKHIIEDGLEKRAKILLADVHDIPLPDNSVDLVVSRGSLWFWDDPGKAVKEIYRILAPGGKAYIGGGKGSPETQHEIEKRKEKMAKMSPQKNKQEKNSAPFGIGERMQKKINYRKVVEKTGIKNFDVIKNEGDFYGMWIYLWK
jgi:ubiquinone/menaquinone biosynthesis C-methylase UbiE